MNGILLINKTKGPSSFEIVRQLKKLTKTKKIGHAGTLDPLASGLLIICLGSYTKFAGLFSDHDKSYESVITLGISTSTDDSEGEILFNNSCDFITKDELSLVLKNKFSGFISQVPPKYSAIKISGQRAYKLARAQEDFEIKARQVQITKLALKEFKLPNITIEVSCSKGTYIRSLARDIGHMLGVGAHAKEICRISSGSFDLKEAVLLENLDLNKNLQQGKAALKSFESIDISESERDELRQGRSIAAKGLVFSKSAVAFFKDEPIALVLADATKIRPIRLI